MNWYLLSEARMCQSRWVGEPGAVREGDIRQRLLESLESEFCVSVWTADEGVYILL